MNTDLDPGLFRSAGGEGCYWARLKGFSGELGDIIANENTDNAATVQIAPSDVGFTSNGCGDWSKG